VANERYVSYSLMHVGLTAVKLIYACARVGRRYLNVVSRLVNADRTVFSFAERLSVHLVSTVHEKHMECVIHDHVNRPDGVGRALGEFWLRSFFAVPSWNTDLV
jgi:hypothetical protein